MFVDEHWSKLRKILRAEGIYDKPTLRLMVEGMLYRLRAVCPWRDLPECFGHWNSIYKKFNAWSASGKWRNIFRKRVIDPDVAWEFIDGSYVKAHPHSAGAAGKESQAIGQSRAGNTSKTHLAVDSYGLPIEFVITGGETHNAKTASEFIAQLSATDALIADKGYDSEAICELVEKKGAKAVILRKSNSVIGSGEMDWALYRYRHLVENAFARLKQLRAVATCYDKLKRNYESSVAMACEFLWLSIL